MTLNYDFNIAINFLFEMLYSNKKFSFSKYADGEYSILVNQKITNCDGWVFNPDTDQIYRNELLESFKFNEDGYYVGISCPCCVPQKHVDWMKKNVGVKKDNLTWANIFVNNNYNYYKKYFIPFYKENQDRIILVSNKNSKISNLPFKPLKHIPIGNTAWKENFELIDILPFIEDSDMIYLFSAGPLGNMLAAKMWKYNKNNTYLDIGSTLNNFLVGNNRGYLKGASTLNKKCIW